MLYQLFASLCVLALALLVVVSSAATLQNPANVEAQRQPEILEANDDNLPIIEPLEDAISSVQENQWFDRVDRSGSKPTFIRFGKRAQPAFIRFGKRAAPSFVRFGRK
ncbi:hypothetical protein WR25_20448 [Diploscapter pachys]|uniref:Uncharacterized protein n=1 Tax=Diploscapter pachys TaxID=2018661 RepID=A0A2A2LJU0_9BILA|nr:hypothetical protein WR25_20448 [Diploscapter pachys]